MKTSKYYTMHMGRKPQGGFEKTICFRTRKTETGWISEPVMVLNGSKQVLDSVSMFNAFLDEVVE